MTRLPDWHSRLSVWLASIARTPFRPGTLDCVIFAADWRLAVTGIDLIGPHRGAYRSLKSGFKRLKAEGWADHIAAATQGLEECPPALVRPGDLVAVAGGDLGLDALGGCGGAYLHVLRPEGVGTLPMTAATRAWRL